MFIKGKSGNPHGRPRGERTITAAIQKALDKEKFVADLIALAAGGKGIEPTTQLGAMRLILGYVDGLPIARTEIEGGDTVNIRVTYVQNNRVDVTSITPGPSEGVERGAEVQCPPCGPEIRKIDAGPACVDERGPKVPPGGVDLTDV
jgi:hypothetical protein